MLSFSVLSFSRQNDGLSFYIKSELGIESNIFEDSTRIQAIHDQWWFGINHNHQSARQQLNLKMMANLSLYNDYHDENKALNMLFLNHDYLLRKNLFIRTNIEVFNKQWYRNNHGYTSSLVNTAVNYHLNNFQILSGIEYKFNYFPSLLWFNSDNTGLFIQIFSTASDHQLLSLIVAHHSIHYSDRIIYQTSETDTTYKTFQKDKMVYIQLGSEFRKKSIHGLYFRFVSTRSNSHYSSFQSASMHLFSAQRIGKFYTQIILDMQLKKYSDTRFQPLVIINADPEQNIQNQLMLGWDRPLSLHLSLQGKIAYIRNETIYSNQYYDKWFTSVGLMYRF